MTSRKYLIYRFFREDVHAEDLQDSCEAFLDPMLFFENRHQKVDADCDPDLGADGVFVGAVKRFDPQVLLDPFEKEFDLPAVFVDRRNGQRGQVEVIRNKDKRFASLGIHIANAPDPFGVVPLSLCSFESNNLVAPQAAPGVDVVRFDHIKAHVALGPQNEECAAAMNPVEALEIDISPVHDIDASGLEQNRIEDVHVVNAPVCDADKHRDGTVQVDYRVKFDRRFGPAKFGPRKQRQAKIDSRRIQGVNHLIDIQASCVASIESSRFDGQMSSQVGEHPPVAMRVGVCQVGPGHIAANTHRVKLRATRQTGFDVAQTFAESHLSKAHAQKVIPSRKTFGDAGHRITVQAAVELLGVQAFENLGEENFALIHSGIGMEYASLAQGFAQIAHTLLCPYFTENQHLPPIPPSVNWTPVLIINYFKLAVNYHPRNPERTAYHEMEKLL